MVLGYLDTKKRRDEDDDQAAPCDSSHTMSVENVFDLVSRRLDFDVTMENADWHGRSEGPTCAARRDAGSLPGRHPLYWRILRAEFDAGLPARARG